MWIVRRVLRSYFYNHPCDVLNSVKYEQNDQILPHLKTTHSVISWLMSRLQLTLFDLLISTDLSYINCCGDLKSKNKNPKPKTTSEHTSVHAQLKSSHCYPANCSENPKHRSGGQCNLWITSVPPPPNTLKANMKISVPAADARRTATMKPR